MKRQIDTPKIPDREETGAGLGYGAAHKAEPAGKIRVLQLGSPSGLYGAERWIMALIKSLPAERFTVWVGSVKDEPGQEVPICAEAEAAGFGTAVFESYGRFNLGSLRLVREFIDKNHVDIIHTHGYKTDLIGLLAARGSSCKAVSTPHGWTKEPDFKLRCYETMDRMLFPFFHAVVPLSRAMAEQLQALPLLGNKLRMIDNGVDIHEIEAVETVADAILRWKQEGGLVAGYIGRLICGKGIETLLASLALHGMERWRLALIGDGEQREEFEALASRLGLGERVAFFGFRPDRLSFLRGFDAFVLPSESEGIPRCLMEAMAARVPVVASDIPGCRFLVDHRRTGLLFETSNAEALANSLSSLVSDAQGTRRLVEAAYEHVITHYSARRMASEYTLLYESLMRQ